jgi:hypothetical protein
VIVGQSLVEQTEKLLARLWALSSPPEPTALRFMKGAEQDGNARGLEPLQLNSDRINILDQEGVIRIPGIG